jgi:hypothetical protein
VTGGSAVCAQAATHGNPYSYRIDPLKSWVVEYRKQFRTIRDQHWRRDTWRVLTEVARTYRCWILMSANGFHC